MHTYTESIFWKSLCCSTKLEHETDTWAIIWHGIVPVFMEICTMVVNTPTWMIFLLYLWIKKYVLMPVILNASMKFCYNQEFDKPNETKSGQCARCLVIVYLLEKLVLVVKRRRGAGGGGSVHLYKNYSTVAAQGSELMVMTS